MVSRFAAAWFAVGLGVVAGVFNVTDEEYYNWNDVRGLSSEDKDRSEAKRNFSLTAKYEF